MLTTTIIIYFALGGLTAYFAIKQKKNPYLWFFIGVLFGIWGLMILFFLRYRKNKKKQTVVSKKKIILTSDKFWYYLNPENQTLGPFSIHKLQNLWVDNKISSKTYVWNEDLKNWKYLKDIKEYYNFQKISN